jgi:two-component system sensor histidine kinase KdpD
MAAAHHATMKFSTEDFWARFVALRWLGRFAAAPLFGYAASIATVVLVGCTSWALGLPHYEILFLAATLLNAVLWGRWQSLLSVVLGIAIVDFFFIEPIYSFVIVRVQDAIDLVAFSVLALLCSDLAAYVRRSAWRSEQLYAFSTRLAAVVDDNQVAVALADELGRALKGSVVVLLPSERGLAIAAPDAGDYSFSARDLEIADTLWREHGSARAMDRRLASGWTLRSLRSLGANIGIVAMRGPAPSRNVDGRYLDAVLDQSALAIERMRLAKAQEDARVQAKADNLRDALINSISHDLQTPLASILGSATSLQSYDKLYSPAERASLVATIREEAERLDHIIGNVVDLSRIRSGDLSPRLELVEISDVISAARARARKRLAEHHVAVSIPPGLPMLKLDLFLMEHAFVNLFENAAKYAPTGSRIEIRAARTGDEVVIDLADAGIGIASANTERIFDRFFRAGRADGRPAGTGLGLTICRAFIEANGGRIEALSPGLGKGATFRITLPVPAADAALATMVEDE